MSTYRALTVDEMTALRAYAWKYGRTWKATLRDEWMAATSISPVHALRNSHGPTWLSRFKFPAGPSYLTKLTAGALMVAALAGSAFAQQPTREQILAAPVPSPLARIDINRASQADLELLPRVGPVLAVRIIAGRPYSKTVELTKVKGIKGKTFALLAPLVVVEVD